MYKRIDTIIMGGTFNPVHIGHMHIAEEALKLFNAERVILVPSFIPAHKSADEIIEPEHRVRMLEIACRKSDIMIEKCEIERGGISYSIDTIKYIKKAHNMNTKPGLLIGDDLAPGFLKWKNTDEIVSEAEIIIAGRDFSDGFEFYYNFLKMENLKLNISSSEIRERLKDGRACRYLMPEGVYEYIRNNELYGVK